MKTMSKYLISLFFLIIAVASFLVIASVFLFSSDVERFNSFSDVKAASLIDKGWVPAFLPTDAFDIVHYHDLDTSESVTEFRYTSSFFLNIKEQVRPVPHELLKQRKKEVGKILKEFSNVDEAKYFEIVGSDMDAYLAIDDVSKCAIYWTVKKRF